MVEKNFKVTFQPDGKTVYVLPGTSIFEAAGEAGIILRADCGGRGTCGQCRVRVIQGKYEERGSERFFTDKELKRGNVLACRAEIKSDITIEVPISSRFFEQKILTEGIERPLKLSPNVKKIFIKVDEPTLTDQRSDLDRVWDALKLGNPGPRVSVEVLRRLPIKLRKSNYSATIVLNGDEIIGIEAGDKSDRNYGVAVDIGTTTVVGYLLDLNTGVQLAVSSMTNPQTNYGDDVISRIHYTTIEEDGLDNLHRQIISCINTIIEDLVKQAGIERKFIYEVTTTGNTTMNHLFLKLNPQYLSLNPYVGVLRTGIDVRASELGLQINRYGKVYTMPNIAGFVGGDTVAVILSSEIHKSRELKFAIDIGTNGELVMGNRERLIACSTAAGPAFEGARITFGMRAAEGAIEQVVITENEIVVNTIGNARPVGICGTGLIDCIAELLRIGVIDHRGKLLNRDELPPGLPDFVKDRLIEDEKFGISFILVPENETQTGNPILLTQKDIRETQLAKGAIFAGYQILKQILGVKDSDITEVLLAGAFGNYIRRHQAKRVGLLPDVPTEKIKFIGNAAGSGAKMVLLARELREEASEISRNTQYIELGAHKDFQKVFAESMFFPETETSR
ncbi:MAG: ASKHA domain-containing protein [Spirochaetota bacterium]